MKTVSYHIPCVISFQGKGKALPGFIPGRAASICSGFNLHPACQGEGDPVPAVHRHAVNQRRPQALVELGDELRQVLYALDEALDLPAADHDLTDLLDDLTQKNRMRMHTVMHSHPIFCPNLSTKGPNQVFFQSCLMNTCPGGRLPLWSRLTALSLCGFCFICQSIVLRGFIRICFHSLALRVHISKMS